ncbi:MAG: transcription termination factor NusA [Chloroflexota bacterium]
MKSEFLIAITQLAAERNLPQGMVIGAVEAALASAYRKEGPNGAVSSVRVHLDPDTGEVEVFQQKTVVEEVTNELAEVTLPEAKKLRNSPVPTLGEVLEFPMEPQAAGRIAAQTAKQVVIQRLREAERELIFAEFSEKVGEVFTATVQRGGGPGGVATVDLNGRATGVLPPAEQAQYERYRPGLKIKVLITAVEQSPRGPEIIVSRAHPDLLRRLFEMEVPEIYNGIVEIRGIAREAGSRAKVAVHATQEGVDPVGACVGLRGIRIQNIVNELQGEKIDVIQWSKDEATFISHALSPAQPLRVDLDDAERAAGVVVPDRQLSLAIGREGQNARLAAKLTGWKVDIKSSTEVEIERMKLQIEGEVAERAAASAATVPADSAAPAPAAVPKPAPLAAEAPEPVAASAADDDAAIMAELEAEAAAAAKVAEEATGGLTPEEMLALESLDAPPAADEEVVEEVVIEDDDDIWKIPEAISGGPQIRFAEDILGERRGGSNTGRRRGGGNRGGGNRGGNRPGGAKGGGRPGGPRPGGS